MEAVIVAVPPLTAVIVATPPLGDCPTSFATDTTLLLDEDHSTFLVDAALHVTVPYAPAVSIPFMEL